jgi:general secretion pathway protein C
MNKLITLLLRFTLSTRWIALINIALAAVLGYNVVQLLLLFEQTPPLLPARLHSKPATMTNQSPLPTLTISALLETHLFGTPPNVVVTASARVLAPPPETSLDLKLHGIYYSSDPQASRAIIATSDGKIARYQRQDTLPSGAIIHQIDPKELILLRNGRQETLHLVSTNPEGLQKGEVATKNVSTNTATTNNNLKPEQVLGNYQRRLQSGPQNLMNLIRLSPVNQDGRFIGYRLSPGKDANIMSQFNLQPGDILTAVNGVKLDSPIKGLTVIEQLATADHLELQILRDGRLVPLSFTVEK